MSLSKSITGSRKRLALLFLSSPLTNFADHRSTAFPRWHPIITARHWSVLHRTLQLRVVSDPPE
jgi:hypothetical protein